MKPSTAFSTHHSSLITHYLFFSPQSLLIFFTLVAYCLPWLVNPGISLTYGVYDLAEWTSLHPVVRASSPALLLTLLLRLPLICVAGVIVFSRIQKTLRVILIIIITVALLPPLEFFTQYPDDPNYRQQFALALTTLILGSIGLSDYLRRWHSIIRIAASITGAVTSIWGLARAYSLMKDFMLPVQIGPGGVAFAVICAVYGLLQVKQTRQPELPREMIQSQPDQPAG
jgi:hypothetical protein